MKILHLCTYYIGNKLYSNLFKELSKSNTEQIVYIPVKNEEFIGRNEIKSKNIVFYYMNILNIKDRLLFRNKIRKQVKNIEKTIDVENHIDIMHAHTLFSDGCAAYYLYKKYGIRYIINVRNTDINVFWKYGLHLRPLVCKVLLNAEKIVFLSPSYKNHTLNLIPSKISMEIEKDCIVVPNGINQYWMEVSSEKKVILKESVLKLLFIGDLNKNKNLESVMLVLAQLLAENIDVHLDIIGDGLLKKEFVNLAEKLDVKDKVKFYGYIKNHEQIKKIMDENNIFVMPSLKETFGLVYIEAMSRGLPVIFTKNQAIDGYFKDGEIGYGVNPHDIEMIASKIRLIKNNYAEMSRNCISVSKNFNWKDITNLYLEIYKGNNKQQM